MDPFRKFLVKPTKSSENQIKLKDWDPRYSGNKSKIDMLAEMEEFSKKISELSSFKRSYCNFQSFSLRGYY